MTITTQSFLSNVVYGDPSGNYDGSSQDWASDAKRAANYYRGQGSLQTITFDFTDFVGTMYAEATLDADADSATWFTTYTYSAGDPVTARQPATITGNFTWMRIRVEDFAGGTINSVTITY